MTLKKISEDDFLKFEKIQKDLLTEEQLFFKTLKTGIEIFEASINDTDGKQLDGAIAFKLHDTYGFPVDLTMAMAQERGLKVDQKGFDKLMKKQREGSKSSSMFKVLDITIDPKINSEFVGYQEQTAKGSCVALFDEEGNSVTSLSGEVFTIFF